MTRAEAIKEIKLLINDVIDYNEKNETHIFFDYHPHVDGFSFIHYNNDKKWHFEKENIGIHTKHVFYTFGVTLNPK